MQPSSLPYYDGVTAEIFLFHSSFSRRSCWRKWKNSMSEPKLRCQMRCLIPPSYRLFWTWVAVLMWSYQSCHASNRSFSRPVGLTRWVHNKTSSVPPPPRVVVMSSRFLLFYVPGSCHLGGASSCHTRADEEADRFWGGPGSPPCCGEGHGWTTRDSNGLRKMGGQGSFLSAGQVWTHTNR